MGQAKGDCQYLIRETEEYIVFIDRECDVDWLTNGIESYEGYNAKKYNALMSAAAVAETKPCSGFAGVMTLRFKRLIGEALVCNFEAAYDNARQMVDAGCTIWNPRLASPRGRSPAFLWARR